MENQNRNISRKKKARNVFAYTGVTNSIKIVRVVQTGEARKTQKR